VIVEVDEILGFHGATIEEAEDAEESEEKAFSAFWCSC
jgi:hypothetical protein